MMARMSCFYYGMSVFLLVLLSQTGIVLAVTVGFKLTGTVSFRGTMPIAETIPVTENAEVCGKDVLIQTVQVHAQTLGLRQVVVSLQGVPSSIVTDESLPKRIFVNANCAFLPRVGAARIGETLEIQNLDPILHNTHVKIGKKTFLNVAQLAGSRPIPKTLRRTGLHTFRCDKHKFMTGSLLVFDHPYFAITNEFGVFYLPRPPAGTYTIVVWHETLGSLEQEVTVDSRGTVTIHFDYP